MTFRVLASLHVLGISDGRGYEPFVTQLSRMLFASRPTAEIQYETTGNNAEGIPIYTVDGQTSTSELQILGLTNSDYKYSALPSYSTPGNGKIGLVSSKKDIVEDSDGNITHTITTKIIQNKK